MEPRSVPGPAIEARRLTVAFGRTHALAGVDLVVDWGERLVLFGPNGAGKTTLLRTLAGLTRPGGGEVRVAGRMPADARGQVGVVLHRTLLYEELTARENLLFYAQLYAVSRVEKRVCEVLEQVGLFQRRDERVASLSRGMQQRLALARAVLHDPPILLLDEPETGLDLAAAQVLEALVMAGPPRTVVLASHHLEQGLRMAQRAVLLVRGRLVYCAATAGLAPSDLEAEYRRHLVPVR